MSREWKPGDPLPEREGGYTIPLEWNEVALTRLLRAAAAEYEPGYHALCRSVMEFLHGGGPAVIDPEDPELCDRLFNMTAERGGDPEAFRDALREFARWQRVGRPEPDRGDD